MLIEAGFFLLAARAVQKALARAKIPPEREAFYHEALANLDGPEAPEKFKTIAKQYRKWGYTTHAKILERRAEWLLRPAAKVAEHRAIIAKAMKSTKVDGILDCAAYFEYWTATGVARDLRDHAEDVKAGTYRPEEEPKAKQNGHVETPKTSIESKQESAN
jgi:hypothetical protein